jgi:hypothetical protein
MNPWHPQKAQAGVSDPCSKENREKRRVEQRGKDTFDKMIRNMNKKKPPPKPPKKPVDPLRSATQRAAAALRTANRERENTIWDVGRM